MASDRSSLNRTLSVLITLAVMITLVGGMAMGVLVLASQSPGSTLAWLGVGILIVQVILSGAIWQTGHAVQTGPALDTRSATSGQVREGQHGPAEQEHGRTSPSQSVELAVPPTPAILITRGVIALPLVGRIDNERLQSARVSLLQGIEHHRAQVAIVDLTGAVDMAAEAIGLFSQILSAAELMGCRTILSGINTPIVRTFLSQKAEFPAETCRDLQAGISRATELLSDKPI